MAMEQGTLCRHAGMSKAGPWEQEGALGSLQAELAANGVDQGRGFVPFFLSTRSTVALSLSERCCLGMTQVW